jgi:Transglycosylase SLT domain
MKKYTQLINISLMCALLLSGCGEPNSKKQKNVVSDLKVEMAEVKADISQFEPIIWEKSDPTRKEWSKMIYSVIENEERSLLENNVAKDIHTFCPQFDSLNQAQRINFWGQFFAALAKPESGWNPTSQMVESNQGIDPVTKNQVMSEGLLQLSYQDEKSYDLDCGFDWGRDSQLAQNDARKTILNPLLNLRCGVKIMAHRLRKDSVITKETGVYWAVLRKNSRGSKISTIATMTKSLKICQ